MKITTKILLGMFILGVIVVGCAFAAPDTFVSIVNLFKQAGGQAVQTVQTAQKVDEAKKAVENTLKPAQQSRKVVVQTATPEEVTIEVVPNREQAETVITATPQDEPTVAPTVQSRRRVVVRATIAPAPTEEPTAIPAVPVVEESVAEPAVENQTTVDNSTTNNSTDLSVEAAAGAIVLAAPENAQPQEAANSPEEKTHADKLAITTYNDSVNMHWIFYDSYNNPDNNREADYPVFVGDWCKVIARSSFINENGEEDLSYGAQSAVAHAVSLSTHGQPSQLERLATFTANACKLNEEDSRSRIVRLVNHP